LPLVLRREPFGGILFDPADATHLELDAHACEVVRDWLSRGVTPAAADAQGLLADVRRQLSDVAPGERRLRLLDRTPSLPLYTHATVLTAPTLVDIQLTRRCNMGCPHCYASSRPDGEHMPFADIERALHSAAELGVCQLALGGGEPLLHPRFEAVLDLAFSLGMVTNLTTTGDGMTARALDAMQRCCGAVALSLEGVGEEFSVRRKAGFRFFEESLARLVEHGIRPVFQVTLSAESLRELPSIVDYCLGCPSLYGVIFLAYKPVGRGRGFNEPLARLPAAEVYAALKQAFVKLAAHTRVGYDCCLTPAITGIDVEMGLCQNGLLEGCSAGRSSVGITPELDVVPCTFATHRAFGNLRQRSLLEIWHGEAAARFRERLDSLGERDAACRACPSRRDCLGGCPEWELVRCTRSPDTGAT